MVIIDRLTWGVKNWALTEFVFNSATITFVITQNVWQQRILYINNVLIY